MLNKISYENQFINLENDLISRFGKERLEETAFPVYYNKFSLAAYLGWSRILTAQKLLDKVKGNSVLDFGSGLGVSLPYLCERFSNIVACDLDIEITEYIVKKLNLKKISLINDIRKCNHDSKFDIVLALDVLEHVQNLNDIYSLFNKLTKDNGVWIISGPTENFLYKMARKVARTTGEGHVRNIYDVFRELPINMVREQVHTLPWGIPLFLVGRFKKKA